MTLSQSYKKLDLANQGIIIIASILFLDGSDRAEHRFLRERSLTMAGHGDAGKGISNIIFIIFNTKLFRFTYPNKCWRRPEGKRLFVWKKWIRNEASEVTHHSRIVEIRACQSLYPESWTLEPWIFCYWISLLRILE